MRVCSAFVESDRFGHDRKAFDCGRHELNEFLQRSAARHRDAGISKTMVLIERDVPAQICAYYTLSHTEIARQTLPSALGKKLPRYPVPVLLIAQLAVSRLAQRQGLGKITLIAALRQCYAINVHLPSWAVVVGALDADVQRFYLQFGFQLPEEHNERARLFLPMVTVAQLFGGT